MSTAHPDPPNGLMSHGIFGPNNTNPIKNKNTKNKQKILLSFFINCTLRGQITSRGQQRYVKVYLPVDPKIIYEANA